MEDIFELMTETNREEGDKMAVSLVIRVKVAEHETICRISRICNAFEDLEAEVHAIKNQLEGIRNKAKEIFRGSSLQTIPDLRPDMTPEQTWTVLSDIPDEDLFINSFNSLDEKKRKEVAEYVLTKCNIFAGKASTFSSRYNSQSGVME